MDELPPMTIFLVEDDEVAAEAIKRGFARQNVSARFIEARDGRDALDALTSPNFPIDSKFIILLDLNLPRIDGIEFLQLLRTHDRLKSAIVFVLTTSDSEEDRRAAYRYNVAGYLLKDRMDRDFAEVVAMLHIYWNTVEFPGYDEEH